MMPVTNMSLLGVGDAAQYDISHFQRFLGAGVKLAMV